MGRWATGPAALSLVTGLCLARSGVDRSFSPLPDGPAVAWGMADPTGAVFVDLDRTLLRSASGPVLQDAMVAEGVLSGGRHLPGESLMYGFYNRFGESVPSIGLARAAARYMRGRSAEATRRAGKRAVEPLVDLVQPWALEALHVHRAEGLPLVLATTSPHDLVSPLAEALGFDDVVATRYAERDGRYTGHLDGGFVWGFGKRAAVGQWAADHDVDLRASHAYTDSVFDLPLLLAVGHPHPLNADPRLVAVAMARRWPLEHWDRPPGIPSLIGFEPYHLVRPLFRPQAFPYARFDLTGLEHIPSHGPVLLASNHRSYFDVAAIGMVAARLGRPVRFLAKQEVFDAPVVGPLARSLGGIAVERGAGSSEPMRRAAAALRAGEVVIVLPQGTIPRGESFFDPRAARPHRHGPSGRRDRGPGGTGRAVGHGAGVAPVVEGAQRHQPAPSPPGHRDGRGPGRPRPGGCRGRYGHLDGGHRRPASRGVPAAAHPHRRGPGPDPTLGVTVRTGDPDPDAPGARLGGGRGRSGPRTGCPGRSAGGAARWPAGGWGWPSTRRCWPPLARGRRVALVTGTNGKTTTTRMLVAALSGPGRPVVISNDTGANMPAGHVAALAGAPAGAPAVLEVDEGYLGRLIEETSPRVVVLLNLSRDQLDRISEVRILVDRWRAALGRLHPGSGPDAPGTVVVANADDPMVTWAAMAAPVVRWVGAGQVWHLDAVGCPSCGGRIVFAADGGWACDRCAFARPDREAWLEDADLVVADGSRYPIELGLPGQFNRANAAMVVLAVPTMVDATADHPDPG